MSRIALRNVTKSFGQHTVLNGVSLDIDAGQCISLIGPSGSGKSTLLRCINLLEPIDDGEILLDGVDISVPGLDANPVRRRIGMVFQSYNLFPHMSVLQNITLSPVRALGIPKDQAVERALALLERFGLADKATSYPDQLSGGMRQRAAIARALTTSPRLLLMDEPFAAVDELTRDRLNLEVLDVWASTGPAVLFVTHSIEEAVFLADRVVVLTRRPARAFASIPTGLPRPRSLAMKRDTSTFAVVAQVRAALEDATR